MSRKLKIDRRRFLEAGIAIPSGFSLSLHDAEASAQHAGAIPRLESANFVQRGKGALPRAVQAKLRERISVIDFGATGDGKADDTNAFMNALDAASGGSLYVPTPRVGYRITSTLGIPKNTSVYGDGKETTRIYLDADVDHLTLAQGGSLQGLFLDGNSRMGNGVVMKGAAGQQSITQCRITDYDPGPNGGCIKFERTTSGAGFRGIDILACQRNGTSGSGRYAVWIEDAQEPRAQPRHFFGFESAGRASFRLGGCNSFYVLGGFVSDVEFSTHSRVFTMTGARWASPQERITIRGGQHCIASCDVFPTLVLAPGSGGCVIGPNAYNNSVPTDSSGGGTNLVYHLDQAYLPVLSAGHGGSSLGNGTITGYFNRQGNKVRVNIQLVVGSTTNLGAGLIQFSLPPNAQCFYPIPQECGNARGLAISADAFYYAVCEMAANATAVEMRRESVASLGTQAGFTGMYPVAWTTGDTFNLSFEYVVGV